MIIPMTAPIGRDFGMTWRITATTLIVAIVFGISVFEPNLDMVNNLSGAFSVFFLVGLFPGVIGWKLLDKNAGWMGVNKHVTELHEPHRSPCFQIKHSFIHSCIHCGDKIDN
jgi:hypothetical protein